MRKIKLLKQTGNGFDEMFWKEEMLFGLNDLELLVLLAWIEMGLKYSITKCCFEMIWTHALTIYRLQKNVGLCCLRHFLFEPISPKAVLPHFFIISIECPYIKHFLFGKVLV